MVFNSFNYLVFFPIVCFIYWCLKIKKFRNPFLLIASYFFYMNWKPVFALLLLGATLISYTTGLLLEKSQCEGRKKWILTIGLMLTFSILFFYKYYNFINDTIVSLLSTVGFYWPLPKLELLLPIGISFYTFQATGYCIDVYRGTVKAERNPVTFALFVSFFPVILAGPIQRAKNLLAQLNVEHKLLSDDIIDGLRMMIWGFFMKLCVADRLGTYVDSVFNNLPHHNGMSVAIASIFYTIQIYGDFAGYSLVALGSAKSLGFNLPDNFRRPYFSTTFKEFWKRWHIALSSWFGDYLYIPLGGNRVRYGRYLLNLMIVFLVSGLWHGAAWTFVIWGGLHGIYQIIEAVRVKVFGKIESSKWYVKIPRIILVFLLVNFAWIFFRANTISDAFVAIGKIFTDFGHPFISPMAMYFGLMSSTILFVKDFADEFHPGWRLISSPKRIISYITMAALVVFIFLFGVLDSSQFIYFQF